MFKIIFKSSGYFCKYPYLRREPWNIVQSSISILKGVAAQMYEAYNSKPGKLQAAEF